MAKVRGRFDRELLHLTESVLDLGHRARRAAGLAVQALNDCDAELAREVVAGDDEINRLRFELEKQCNTLLATEQPVAGDLRAIIAALTVATDLERIGDHGKRLARITLRMVEQSNPLPGTQIVRLAELALALVDRALHAYANRDLPEAEAVCLDDDGVDAYYKQTFNVFLSYMLEDPHHIDAATQLIQAAHELERIGDRATNIGERVIYTVTGELTDRNL